WLRSFSTKVALIVGLNAYPPTAVGTVSEANDVALNVNSAAVMNSGSRSKRPKRRQKVRTAVVEHLELPSSSAAKLFRRERLQPRQLRGAKLRPSFRT